MKLVVVAATGGIGRTLLAQATERGHDVVAAVRDPARLPDATTAAALDLSRATPDDVAGIVAGADAVLSCLGPRGRDEIGVVARGTRTLVEGLATAGPRRLVAVSAAPVGTLPTPGRPRPPRDPGDDLLARAVLMPLLQRVLRRAYADLAAMEAILRASDLDWTVVRPPRLTDAPRTGSYRWAVGANLPGGRSVARADVADLMLAVLDRPETVRTTVGVAT